MSVYFLFVALSFIHAESLELRYHSNEEIEIVLESFVQETKSNFKYLHTDKYVIGSTKEGYNLSVVTISSSKIQSDIFIPNVKLIGNIHGNEVVGRELLLHFLFFLRDNYNNSYTIARLLNSTKIHVMPTMNPDGFKASTPGCDDEIIKKNSAGKDGVDLNINFPVLIPPYVNKIPQARETRAVIDWMERVPFVLSAALHGEAIVARYPFDTIMVPKWQTFLDKMQSALNDEESDSIRHEYMASVDHSPPQVTPDDDVFRYLASVYAQNHLTMHQEVECYENIRFKNGIVNGAQYNVSVGFHEHLGGMQDYNYKMQGCMEVIFEISCCPYPEDASELAQYWEENKLAILKYSLEANRGIVGRVVDGHTEEPIGGASLKIRGRDITFKSRNTTGIFWRLLLDGTYILDVSADGYFSESVKFTLNQRLKEYPKLLKLPTIYLWNESLTTIPVSTSAATLLIRRSNLISANVSTTEITESSIEDIVLNGNYDWKLGSSRTFLFVLHILCLSHILIK